MALFARLARERQVAVMPGSTEVSPVDVQPQYYWSAPAPFEPTQLADATPRAASAPAPRPYARPPPQPQQPRPMIPLPYQEVRAMSLSSLSESATLAVVGSMKVLEISAHTRSGLHLVGSA